MTQEVKESILAMFNPSENGTPNKDSTFDMKASNIGHKLSIDQEWGMKVVQRLDQMEFHIERLLLASKVENGSS